MADPGRDGLEVDVLLDGVGDKVFPERVMGEVGE